MNITFAIRILSSNLRILLFLNSGSEWLFLCWLFIILRTFFCRVITLHLAGIRVLPPFKVCIIYMWIKDCKVNCIQIIKTNIISNFLEQCICNPSNSYFFNSARKCQCKIGFSQFMSTKKMPTQKRLFSIFTSKMVIYACKMVICLSKMIFLSYHFLLLYNKL